MRDYDPGKPLIFIHVPKTAGSSVREVVKGWFPGRSHHNYAASNLGPLPKRLPDAVMNDPDNPPVIYGHFNRNRQFGVEHLYPDVTQFLTILRDPFETKVSDYFYIHRRAKNWPVPPPALSMSLEAFLTQTPPNYLNHFPQIMTMETYRDQMNALFIEVGITEALPQSLSRIASKLGRPFDPADLPRLNISPRDQEPPPGARAWFRQRWPLEHAVYDYARSRYLG